MDNGGLKILNKISLFLSSKGNGSMTKQEVIQLNDIMLLLIEEKCGKTKTETFNPDDVAKIVMW